MSDNDDDSQPPQGAMTFTCYFCEDRLHCLPDGRLRTCQCGVMTIDHTEYYTRFIGTKPVEELTEDELKKYAELKKKHMVKLIFYCYYYSLHAKPSSLFHKNVCTN